VSLTVDRITSEEHLAYITTRRSVSFLQTPAWGAVKSDWRSESLGWRDEAGVLRGAGLVLYRKVPKVKRYLAYLPEGPDIPWEQAVESGSLDSWLKPMSKFLAGRGAFAIRMGPSIATRRWSAKTIKAALAQEGATSFRSIEPDEQLPEALAVARTLNESGWLAPGSSDGFGMGQPQFVFQLPLPEDESELLRSFNQLWRRNIKRADREGVVVELGEYDDLVEFHELYTETAVRDDFTPRPLSYFQNMWKAMASESPHRIRLYLARHEGDLVAATTMTQVGVHAWYSYGASSSNKRDVRGSNAIQWRMIRDAVADGATVYDLRGITDTLDATDPLAGLIQFKVGTGGQAVEYLGEWTLPLNRLMFKAFEMYLSRR
jgi:lipid II:glycine glycyltransferase (peptidoglycan interpeptide bridge formation enzyme)